MRSLALVLTLLLAKAAHADCAQWGLAPKVLTATDAVVPSDGGIVVGAIPDARGALDKGDAAVQRGWRIHVGSDTLKPPIDTLAPGLAVYRAAMPNAYKVELVDAGGAVVASVRPAKGSGDKLAAPAVKHVTFEAVHPDYHGFERLDVELDGDAPAGTLAMIVADEHGKPKSWGSAAHPYDLHDCQVLPNGTVPSHKGETITLAWVDVSGRVSAWTKPIKVE